MGLELRVLRLGWYQNMVKYRDDHRQCLSALFGTLCGSAALVAGRLSEGKEHVFCRSVCSGFARVGVAGGGEGCSLAASCSEACAARLLKNLAGMTWSSMTAASVWHVWARAPNPTAWATVLKVTPRPATHEGAQT